MTPANIECLRCRANMDEGFVIDRGHGNQAADVATWVSGTPESSWLGGIKTKGHDQYRLATFLCRKCGYVEFRAMETKQG